jgi:cysteine desulfurase/selenocysteine lyase
VATSFHTAAADESGPRLQLDIRGVRRQFPALRQLVRGHPLAYLDNAATTQKPAAVLRAIERHYERANANVHRGVHTLGARATEAYEAARQRVGRFLGARDPREIVFTRGTTEAINLVAQSWGRTQLTAGDEVIVTALEHHANLLPWRRLCDEVGATLRVVPVDARGTLVVDAYARFLGARTRLVAVAHAANALGTVTPVAKLVRLAHAVGAVVLVDGAVGAAHLPVDVAALDCDFYACSGHKLYGPTGVGVLYGKAALLDAMPPWQTGGDMVLTVGDDAVTYAPPPHRFEAGTPPVAAAIGLAAAIDWLAETGFAQVRRHERALLAHATEALGAIPSVRLVGTAPDRVAIVSFVVDGIHPHDVATVLDDHGVAVRAGDQCAQPLMRALGLAGTVRASLALYNTDDEIERLAAAVRHAVTILR